MDHLRQHDLRLTDPEVVGDPYPYYESLHRSACPVREEPGVGYIVHRHDDVLGVARDLEHFSTGFRGSSSHLMGLSPEPYSEEVKQLVAQYHPMRTDMMLFAGRAEHAWQRALVNKALNPRRALTMEPMMRAAANELVGEFVANGCCEFQSQFAARLPAIVIADTLGINHADAPIFQSWAEDLITGFVEIIDNVQRAAVARSVLAFQEYMLERIEERRAAPRDDLLSDLIHAHVDASELEDAEFEGKRLLDDAEVLGIVVQLITAGIHTTSSFLGVALVRLLERPQLMKRLRSDFDLIPAFLEEVLRHSPPVHMTYRSTTSKVEIGGVEIPAGAIVMPMWGAANQDPDVFPEPREFDIERQNNGVHLAFGKGTHFCVGARVARADSRIAFETLLTRLQNVRLVPGQTLEYGAALATRGYREIHIRFDAAH